jgi:choline dehydrogenase-like flavoprotein
MTNKSAEILSAYAAQTAEQYLPAGSHATVIAGYNAQKKLLEKYLATDTMGVVEFIGSGPGFSISQQHPLSRGYLKINSSNPFDYPIIDFRYHTNPLDFSITSAAIRFTRTIIQTSVYEPLRHTELLPGATASSDEALATFVAERLRTMYHSCCTNPMQPLELGGVVDSKLKVFGVANLRYEIKVE